MHPKSLLLLVGIATGVLAAPAPLPEPAPQPVATPDTPPQYAPESAQTGVVQPQHTGVTQPQQIGVPESQPAQPELPQWFEQLFRNGYRLKVGGPYTRSVEVRGKSGGPVMETGIKDNEKCAPLTVIFARGSGEDANMGSVVGPPLAASLRHILDNRVAVQGVDYHASMTPEQTSSLEFVEDGGSEIVTLVRQSQSQCPESKIALVGYSLGAMIVRRAASLLEAGEVAAVVAFGDPLKDAAPFENVLEDKVKEFCAPGDPVCMKGTDTRAHQWYGEYAEKAAQFIVQAVDI